MDPFEPTKERPSPRRELQGPRPTPLKVRKDSHKIKKPPVAPAQPQHGALPVQQRPPVIIYTVSPKVIHTHPSEFMSLVQRLTGASSSSSSASASVSAFASTSASAFASDKGEALSPAARLAVIERPQGRVVTPRGNMTSQVDGAVDVLDQLGFQGGARLLDRTGSFPGILSPVPSTLPAIPPNFFSSLPEMNSLNFLHELSPAFHTFNKSNISTENNNMAMVSPSFFLTTPFAPSPNAYWDLFQQYQDT
ncbi:Nuclear speckle RNA-binding protein B [Ananas comosus]|uniref:Nuclear speckle RNA-binding protein B n=1 Tax=Ananas comosus TaxID=4615 RepID=A0A199UKN8_ANACO|nr:Nuclear speckle RNA-binding protein B [Ananas comosus]